MSAQTSVARRLFHVKHSSDGLFGVSRETLDRLDLYSALLLRWNNRINLIGRLTEKDVWARHFLDSLQLAALIPIATRVAVDVGSGAGFPGLVLAIATGVTFHLVESDHRKAAFLREVAAATQAPVVIHAVRIADLVLPKADLITARALAPLADLLAMAAPLLAPTGAALFLKGANAERELTEAEARWHMRVERYPSATDPKGVILRLTEVMRA
jgi:16S rRNA (guanine527-N7)-methyltransferase